MSQSLNLQIPEPLFQRIARRAAAQNTDAASIATAVLQEHFQALGEPANSAGNAGSLEELFGAEDQASVTGLDNEAIDADLAKEYARGLTD